MKLKYFLHALLLLALLSCVQTHAARIRSGWHPLAKAKEMTCTAWPLREKDLRVESIESFAGDPSGFFVTVMRRDSSKDYYFAPVEQDVLPKFDQILPLRLPHGSLLLGGVRAQGKANALVLTGGENGVILETRALSSGLVGQRISVPIRGFEGGRVVPGARGDWLLLEDGEGRHRIYFLASDARGNRELRDLRLVSDDQPKVAFVRGGLLVTMRANKGPHLLKTIWISEKEAGHPSPPNGPGLTVDIGGSFEAWNVGASPAGPIFAGIDGDSMVGEAKLRVGTLDLLNKNSKLQLIGKADLRDIHTTEPFVTETSNGTEILLVNWVDEESTIARYIVKAEGLSKPLFSGVFIKGARIVGQLSSKDSRLVRVLTRHRIESRWVYQICGL